MTSGHKVAGSLYLAVAVVAGAVAIFGFVKWHNARTPAVRPAASDVTSMASVYADGGTYPNICVEVSSMAGHHLRVKFKLNKKHVGALSPPAREVVSNGLDRVCTSYISSQNPKSVGKNAAVGVKVQDLTARLEGLPARSKPFTLHQPLPHP